MFFFEWLFSYLLCTWFLGERQIIHCAACCRSTSRYSVHSCWGMFGVFHPCTECKPTSVDKTYVSFLFCGEFLERIVTREQDLQNWKNRMIIPDHFEAWKSCFGIGPLHTISLFHWQLIFIRVCFLNGNPTSLCRMWCVCQKLLQVTKRRLVSFSWLI